MTFGCLLSWRACVAFIDIDSLLISVCYGWWMGCRDLDAVYGVGLGREYEIRCVKFQCVLVFVLCLCLNSLGLFRSHYIT